MLDSSGIHTRLTSAFECKSVLITSGENSFELICGLLSVHRCKSTILETRIKHLFVDCCTCQVKFYKGWGPICIFLSSRGFIAFGSYSHEQILQMGHNASNHRSLIAESKIHHKDTPILLIRYMSKKTIASPNPGGFGRLDEALSIVLFISQYHLFSLNFFQN